MVNVNPTNTRAHSETPEIRKYKKRFNSEILCAALWGKPGWGRRRRAWCARVLQVRRGLALPLICPRAPLAGVNLLVGTENGLMLLDRSGQGKVYGLIGRRRFQQMDVLEGLNLLITISGWGEAVARRWAQCLGGGLPQYRNWKVGAPLSHPSRSTQDGGKEEAGPPASVLCPSGKRNKLRVYYLSWLRNKILHNDPEVEKKQGWTTVGDMEGCGHYRVGEEVTTQRPGHSCL